MKTLATLVAAAALVSGISVAANAQATKKDGISASTNAEFCLDLRGAKNCKYDTMAACQKDAAGNGTCAKNPNFAANSGSDAMKSRAMEPKAGTATEGGSTGSTQPTDSMNKSAPPQKAN